MLARRRRPARPGRRPRGPRSRGRRGCAGSRAPPRPGDDDVRGARRGGRGEAPARALRDGLVGAQQRSVEIGRDQLVREAAGAAALAHLATGSRTSRPPRYGRSTSGTRTEPSACWWFSRIATIVRGYGAQRAVQRRQRRDLSCRHACGSTGGGTGTRCSPRSRSARGTCPGSGSTPRSRTCATAEAPRSPEATSMTRNGSSSDGQPLLLPLQQALVLGLASPPERRTRTSRPCRTGARGRCRGCPCRTSRPRGGSRARSRRSAAGAGRRRGSRPCGTRRAGPRRCRPGRGRPCPGGRRPAAAWPRKPVPSMALRADQRRGQHRREAGLGGLRDRRVDQRELQQRADAGEVVEARAGDLGAALDVDRAEQLRRAPGGPWARSPRPRSRGSCRASPGRRSPPRRRRARRGARGCRAGAAARWVSAAASSCSASAALTSAASSLGLLQQLGLLVARGLGDQLAERLLLGAQFVEADAGRPAPLVGGEEGVDERDVLSTGALRRAHTVGVLTEQAKVNHPSRLPVRGSGSRLGIFAAAVCEVIHRLCEEI